MKKVMIPLAICAISTLGFADNTAALQAQINELKAQIQALKAAQDKSAQDAEVMQRTITAVKKHDSMDNVKFDIDFRTAYDHVDYKVSTPQGRKFNGKTGNGVWTNKLILGMAAQPRDDLIFRGSLSAYKSFGSNNARAYNPYQGMDWYGTNAPNDAKIKLREAYFLYKGDWFSASLGRRPSLDGFLVNHREDNRRANSPTGHNINMEFDGASFKFDIERLTSISGQYFKLCLGRGNSKVEAKYPTFTGFMGTLTPAQAMGTALPYSKNSKVDSPNMDLAGVIASLYDDGQYKVLMNYFMAKNLMGANFTPVMGANGPTGFAINMTDVGDMTGGSLGVQVDGIGDGISDFLDNTTVFASVAFSKTDPKGKHGTMKAAMMQGMGMGDGTESEMLGSADSKMGTSYYVGVVVPGFLGDDRFGFEYNHGSKYWRSFTYGEDTLAGSKLATRGNAYEAYYNFPLLGKNLTGQLRFTHLDYDYTGSDMFFGSTGTPMTKKEVHAQGMNFVDSASEARISLRYRY